MDTQIDIAELNGIAAGRDAFVVASGPSTGMEKPDRVHAFAQGKVTIGCNDVWRVLNGQPLECDYFVMLDDKFRDDHYSEIRDYLKARPTTMPITHFGMDRPHIYYPIDMNVRSDNELRRENPAPFQIDRYFHGHSSGVAGVQIAMHMGCKRIYLLGHDLIVTPDRTHGFGDRTRERQNDYTQGLTMRSGYDLLKQHADELGVQVVNLSLISAIDCFSKKRRI